MPVKIASPVAAIFAALLSLPVWLPYMAGVLWVLTGYNIYDWID